MSYNIRVVGEYGVNVYEANTAEADSEGMLFLSEVEALRTVTTETPVAAFNRNCWGHYEFVKVAKS